MNLLFFDIDGTLLLSQGAGGKSIVRVLKELFAIEQDVAKIKVHGQTDRGIAAQLFDAHGIPDTDENWSRFRSGYLEILDEELKGSEGSLLPGVQLLLDHLGQCHGVELALLTGNVEEGALKKVRHFGIDHFFRWGGYGDLHRDRVDLAKNALQVAHDQVDMAAVKNVFVIGDTPNDIRCGKAIGAITVGVATSGCSVEELRSHDADHVFGDFADLQSVVELLTGNA